MISFQPSTLTDICKSLNITTGSDKNIKADIPYLMDCLRVDAHSEKLKSLGFDPENPQLRKKIPYPAMYYIYTEVFRIPDSNFLTKQSSQKELSNH